MAGLCAAAFLGWLKDAVEIETVRAALIGFELEENAAEPLEVGLELVFLGGRVALGDKRHIGPFVRVTALQDLKHLDARQRRLPVDEDIGRGDLGAEDRTEGG